MNKLLICFWIHFDCNLIKKKFKQSQRESSSSRGPPKYNRQTGQYGENPSSNSNNNNNDDSGKYSPMNKNSNSNPSGLPSSSNFGMIGYGSNNLDDEDDDDFDSSSNTFKSASSSNFSESSLLREEGKPSGLKNVGNTCWFNSIIQVK